MTRWASGLRAAAALTAATTLTAMASAPLVSAPAAARAPVPLAGPMPSVAIIAQGVSSANQAHLFRSREWDFAAMRGVFTAVSLLPGDRSAVAAARRAGLAVVLEFDYKADFFAGVDISAKVAAVAAQLRADPGTVAAVHVADRLNEKYSASEGLRYLAATGGVLHRLAPGVPVLVNASDWQLTCGLPGQSACGSHGTRYQYETDATLDAFRASGFVDGLSIADNLKGADPRVQATAWNRARSRWAPPFLLWTTCSQLSFGTARYPGTPPARRAVDAYITAPMRAGADGAALWAWHQLYVGQIDTFLDKDGSSNQMWAAMHDASRALGADVGDVTAAPAPATTARPSGRSTTAIWVTGSAVLLVSAVLATLWLRGRWPRRSPPRPHRRAGTQDRAGPPAGPSGRPDPDPAEFSACEAAERPPARAAPGRRAERTGS